jgi:PAS domain S-box-containing protein
MVGEPESPAEEIRRLRRCINDLVSVLALQSAWIGGSPSQVVGNLLDALVNVLNLDFIYARLGDSSSSERIEIIRIGSTFAPKPPPQEIRERLRPWLTDDPQKISGVVSNFFDGRDIALVPLKLGLHGEMGLIVAGSGRSDFPQQTERLVLDVVANQAAIGLHEANVLRELDRRVAQRTAELTSANEQLHEARAALEKAFDEIKRSEAKLRRVIDTIPTIAWCNLPDGPNEFLNKSWHEYTGLSPEESHGWGWQAAFHSDDLPALIERWQQMLVTGEPGEIEARIRHHDGVYRWFLIRAEPFLEEGKLVRWYGTSTDIDDRKRAEEALRDSEQSSRLVLDGIAGLVAIMSATGEVQAVNRQVLEYFGKTVEELKTWSTTDAVHPEDLPTVISAWIRSVETAAPYDVDHRLRGADGVYRWFHARGLPLRDEEGRVVRWYVLLTDIDDRRRAEEALHASERELDLIVNTIPALAWSAHPDGSAEFFNQHYLAYVRLPLEQLQGSGWTVAVHPDDLGTLIAAWQSMLAAGKGGQVEGRLRRFDGEYRWFLLRTNPMLGASGAIVKWYGTNTDIDDRKRAEQELRNTQTELGKVMGAMTMGQLTASIAHEVNQPLSGIVTNAGTCLRMLDANPPNLEGARETVRRMIRDGNRASEVVTRLRTLYSKKKPALEPMDLNEATCEVIALSLSELQRNRVVLRQELADDLPPVLGDRIQIQQVILNLVRNGSDAMSAVNDRPRELTVKTDLDESGGVLLSVKDSGVGIDPEIESKLFEPFYTTKSDGMGIGLSVSRSIMESHRGRLWIARNDGPGATFSLFIPCELRSMTKSSTSGDL